MKNTQEFINEMKQQTIGCEIEMAEITRKAAATVIADYFGRPETVTHNGGSYDTWSCLDGKNRRWQVMSDSSIHASSWDEKAELVTPILTYDDIETSTRTSPRCRNSAGSSARRALGAARIAAAAYTSTSGRTATTRGRCGT